MMMPSVLNRGVGRWLHGRPVRATAWRRAVLCRAVRVDGQSGQDTQQLLSQLRDEGLRHMQCLLPGLQTDHVLQDTFPLTGGHGFLWVGVTAYKQEQREVGILCMAAGQDTHSQGSLSGLTLHWGCTRGRGHGWKPPPHGWVTVPEQSHDAGGNAWQSRFAEVAQPAGAPVHIMSLEIPVEGPVRDGGLAFVLKTDHNVWIKDGGNSSDFFVSMQDLPSLELSSDTNEPTAGMNGAASHSAPATADQDRSWEATRKVRRSGSRSMSRPGALSPARLAAKIERFLESFEHGRHEFPELEAGRPGMPESQGGVCLWMVDRVVSLEGHAERSLMHRYDVASQLVDDAAKKLGADLEEVLMAVSVWLRYAATRHLTWNRNYNVKPREISAAQDRLANKLAQIMLNRPHAREAARMALVATGRGGQGDVGQRIRDEILSVQQRNNAKGGMMEEWHQKLHNNTSPDDVVICQALLEYIRSGLDIQSYWDTLHAENITKERLASFDRPIKSEPRFTSEQCPGLQRDLEAYLVTLQAVHSGTDLKAAAASVFGYTQEARKGRTVVVPAVESVSSPRLESLIEAILYLQAQSERSVKDASRLLKLVVEARFELAPHLCTDCGGRLKDVLFLDMALDNTARTILESSLSEVKALPPGISILEVVLNLLKPAVQNAALSAADKRELVYSLALLDRAIQDCVAGSVEELDAQLLCLAAVDRIRGELVRSTDSVTQRVQPVAEAIGGKLKIDPAVVSVFSEEVVRGTSRAPLAQLIAVVEHRLRQQTGAGDWVVISRGAGGRALGLAAVERGLALVQHRVYPQPVVLFVEQVKGEEEVPAGVVAVISRECPDVLSHAAVRARNSGVLFAACESDELFRELCRDLDGKAVQVRIAGEDDVVVEETDEKVTADPAPGTPGTPALQLEPQPWCGLWVLSPDGFEPAKVGGKSMSTLRLHGKLPPGVEQPASAALPFGVFEQLLQQPANSGLAQDLHQLEQRLPDDLSVLDQLRAMAQQVEGVPDIPQHLLASLQHQSVPATPAGWESMWRALRGVWASKWNQRAALSLRKLGAPLSALRMAVLVQELVPMDYAFVVHTRNPMNGQENELFIDVVRGMGETLVGNHPGRPLSAIVNKKGLGYLREQLEESGSINTVQVPDWWAREHIHLLHYPSKPTALLVPEEWEETPLICRSDSNAEDLPSFAGAGLFDSRPTVELEPLVVDYSRDRLVGSPDFRHKLIGRAALVCCMVEETLGEGPQDIEGGLAEDGALFVVQSRAQV